jgi:glycosyltransferase involved in cell wall biosynthesis
MGLKEHVMNWQYVSSNNGKIGTYHAADHEIPSAILTVSIVVVVPALNEEVTIGNVIAEIPRDIVDRVIIVDNGSTDATARVAEQAGADVVFESQRGYGFACHRGFKAAEGADILVFLDGDGADNPQQIPILVKPIQSTEAALVVGSRERGESEPGALLPHARIGNWLAAQLMRALYGLQVTDLGPFRAIRRSVLEELDMQEMTYGWPTEMMVKAAKRGYAVLEVPVDYRRRAGGRSKISGTVRGTILAGYFIIKTTLRYAWTK